MHSLISSSSDTAACPALIRQFTAEPPQNENGVSGSGGSVDEDAATPEELRAASPCRIMVVEDNPADVFLIREAIAQSGLEVELSFASDGEKAVEFVTSADLDDSVRVPDLVLLDLNLPRRTGAEVLREIRQSRRCAVVPVMIVSSSDFTRDREETSRFGANAYFRKPSSYSGFMELGPAIRNVLAAE